MPRAFEVPQSHGALRGGLRTAVTALALLAFAAAAAAGEAQDRLFAIGALDAVETGQALIYDFERGGEFPGDKLAAVDHGSVRMEVKAAANGGREVIVALDDTRRVETYDPFPATAGNPVFMVFMEQNVQSMAALTGGSPFYIRNRLREALGSQNSVAPVDVTFADRTAPGRQLSFRPFADDPNRDRMGAFADLEISFVMSDTIPGAFARLESISGPDADGKPALRLSMDLDQVEQGD